MKLLKWSGLLSIVILLASCGGSKSTEVGENPKDLNNYSTYAFLPNKNKISTPGYNNEEINSEIVNTINENMDDEGYRYEEDQPQVLIYVHTMFDDKVEVNADPVYTSYSYYRPDFYIGDYYKPFMYKDYYTIQRITGENIQQVPYSSRSIVIDFINRKNNKIIWRGTTNEVEIDDRRTERDVRKYVDEIFKQFP